MKEPPKVTGLSPKEGPPGTKIVIRGENLGTSPHDLIGLTICGIDCLIYADWQSSQKIVTRSGRCKGSGDVIITTKSGGIGSCTVQFRGYENIIGPTTESAVWVNEDVVTSIRNRSISPSSLFPQDPLGLCTDDDSPRSQRPKISEAVLRDFFPEAIETPQDYGNIASENFIPAWYLLGNHSTTSFSDLKRGLSCLKNKIESQTNPNANSGQTTFLKTNVLPVIECLDALKALHLALKKDKQEFGPDLTLKVDDSIRKAKDEAHEIFDSILARKDKVDSTRNALNVLQRYRFLFNLPSNIEKSIQKGDYDVVINDFSRAKSLFGDTQVNLFKKIYYEVEQRIEKFRNLLQDKLKSNCQSDSRNIDEVKKLIKYLINLEVPGNPAWDSVVTIKETLMNSTEKCREKHIILMNKPTTVEPDSFDDDEKIGHPIEAPRPIQFIEELTILFTNTFSDLYKLGQAYLNGDLYFKETEEQLKIKEEIFYKEMMIESVNYLCNQMRAALLPNSIKNIPDIKPWNFDMNESFVIWLPYCLRCVVNCANNLTKLEVSSKEDVFKALQQFIFDLRVNTMTSLFNQTSNEIKNLYLKETWDIELDDNLGARTQLPLVFENKVVESLQLVRETVLQLRNPEECDIFTQINVQGSMKQLGQNLLQLFIYALEMCLANFTKSSSSSSKQSLTLDDATLIVLCNCAFTNNHVIPRLHENFEKYGYPDMNAVIKNVQNKYRDFENKLFDKYIERKCDVVIGAIEPTMYLFSNKWFLSEKNPEDVSSYVKETLMNLIEIQAEVYQIAPPLVNKMMESIIDAALEEIQRIYESVASKLTTSACIQAMIDIGALQIAFDHSGGHIANSAKRILIQCEKCFNSTGKYVESELIDKILIKFKLSMQLQLSCFKYESDQTILNV